MTPEFHIWAPLRDMAQVIIVMGSATDCPTAQKAEKIFRKI